MHSEGGPANVQCRLSVFLPIFTSGERVRSGYTWGLAGNLKAFQEEHCNPSRKSRRSAVIRRFYHLLSRGWITCSWRSLLPLKALTSKASHLRPKIHPCWIAKTNQQTEKLVLIVIHFRGVLARIHVCCLRIDPRKRLMSSQIAKLPCSFNLLQLFCSIRRCSNLFHSILPYFQISSLWKLVFVCLSAGNAPVA